MPITLFFFYLLSTQSQSLILPRDTANTFNKYGFIYNRRIRSSHITSLAFASSDLTNITTLTRADQSYANGSISEKALRSLIERQRRELQESEQLLQELERNHTAGNSYPSSVSESIFSGFDYGYVARSAGCKFDLRGSFSDITSSAIRTESWPQQQYGPPANIFLLGIQQFNRNLNAMRGEYLDEKDASLTRSQISLREKLKMLTLNSTAIWEREEARGPLNAPLIIKIPYLVLCYFLDIIFEGKYVPARFFYLETVARMPYFSYINCLHSYETLGFWRRSADVKRIHFSQEWNEFNHLLIMESLGGDQSWWVRFLAQHSAIAYFLVLTLLWALSPSLSYKFSELLELHAVDTYGQFLDENDDLLKELPPSQAAIDYYALGVVDPLFGEYQTTINVENGSQLRKSGINMRSLYDVFVAIRADEGDHVNTMKSCLDPNVAVLSPSLEKKVLLAAAFAATAGYFLGSGLNTVEDVTNIAAVDDIELVDAAIFDGLFGGFATLVNGLRQLDEEGEGLFLLGDKFTEARKTLAPIIEYVVNFILKIL